MPTVTNEELNQLQRKKHALIWQFDKKEISEEEYNERIKPIEDEIKIKLRMILDENDNEIRKTEVHKEETTMEQEKVKEKPKEKKEKTPSYTTLIIKALMMKSLKTIDECVDKVLEWKPGRDRNNTKTQMKTIIYLVKKQKGKRWEKYDWNDEAFLLTEKTV